MLFRWCKYKEADKGERKDYGEELEFLKEYVPSPFVFF